MRNCNKIDKAFLLKLKKRCRELIFRMVKPIQKDIATA
jgi:hypothetical protein